MITEKYAMDMDVEYAVCAEHVADLSSANIITDEVWRGILGAVTSQGMGMPDRNTATVELAEIAPSEFKK